MGSPATKKSRSPSKPASVEVTDYQSAVRGLIDREWLRSWDHRDALAFTDYTFASEQLADFVGRLLRRAAKMGIPLYCESVSFDVAFIVHSRRKRDLHAKEWEIVAHLGGEIIQQYGLGVIWGGPMMPSCWMSGDPGARITD